MEARPTQTSGSRRRRLLHQQEDRDLLTEFEALSPRTVAAPAVESTVAGSDRSILSRMISGQLWKHGALIALICGAAVLAIVGETHQPQALQELADSRQPRLSKGLAGGFLVLAGQLSLLIAWIRSRSTVDFSGRYRCWKWLAGCLMTIGMLWITNFQDALPQLARLIVEPLIGGVGAARHTLVVVPLASLSLWVLSRVVPDMGRNRLSQIAFCVGVLAAVTRLLMSWGGSAWNRDPAILDGVLLTATGLVVCSLLLHTRFVLYISKDPPAGAHTGEKRADGVQKTDSPGEKRTAEQTGESDVLPVRATAAHTAAADGEKTKRRQKKKRQARRAA